MAKCPPCKKGAPMWMVTFGDMMALLLTFFVLLLSMSQFERVKFEKAVGSIKDTFGVQRVQQINAWPSGNTMVAIEFQQEIVLVRIKEKLELHLSGMIDNGEAELAETDDGFLIRIMVSALFEPGTLILKEDSKPELQQVANLLKDMPNIIRVLGHTSTQPPPEGSPFPDNWTLSAAYSAAVVGFFSSEEGGVDPQRLQARGMGQYSPLYSNDTEEGRAHNLRLEILISRETLPVVDKALKVPPKVVDTGIAPAAGAP